MSDYAILQGDCLSLLCQMPPSCIHTCVTSPPYFGLRDYGVEGQIGLEETPDAYVNKLVNVFREVKRVLRDDGVMFLNLGDSYARQHVPVYDTCDTIPQDCPLHDSIWNRPCDGCQAASVLRSFDKDLLVSPKLSDDSLDPSREHKESGNVHFPKSHSFHQIPIPRSSCAIPDQVGLQALVDEQPPSFQESMPGEFYPQSQDECLQRDNSSFCQDEVGEKNHGAPESEHKKVYTFGTSQKFSFLGNHKNNNHNVYPCKYLTRENRRSQTFKPKDLLGIPWRVAFALQQDGWYLRQDIIWHKPNPMPESVRDRCTKAHEYIFLLSKSSKYYFDAESIEEPAVCDRMRGPALHPDEKSTNGNGGLSRREPQETRNRRSVWSVTTKPFKGAHFATFPPDLIEPCVLAGCPVGGVVLDPFGGAGTTGVVALKHGRKAILLELNPEYVKIAEDRIASVTPKA